MMLSVLFFDNGTIGRAVTKLNVNEFLKKLAACLGARHRKRNDEQRATDTKQVETFSRVSVPWRHGQ